MKRAAIAGLVLLALASVVPGVAAVPTVTLDVQAWWNKAGIVVPTAVGAHIHVRATVPADGAIIDGRVDIPVTVTLHNARGATNWFRVRTETTELFKRDLVLGPCADCSTSFTATINLSGIATGRHELRMSANNPDEDPSLSGSQRMFQSTGFQVCVRSCTPSYRSGVHTEARGWYLDHGYANAKLTTAVVKSGAVIGVRLSPGSGGKPTKFAGIYIDPDFHAGSAGIVVREANGEIRGNVTLPVLPAGPHNLVLLSSDGQNAGVLVVPFVVP